MLALLVTFPAVAVVALVTYLALRHKWPDRLVMWVLTLVGLPIAAAVLWWTDYAGRWIEVISGWRSGHDPTAGDWLAVVAIGAAVGPILGALVWRVKQRKRERSPYSGEDEREYRMRAEEIRRQTVVHWAQRIRHTGSPTARKLVKPLSLPLGDSQGPFVGKYQRGDLAAPWRTGGRVRIPLRSGQVRHLVVLGASGLGKTETTLGPLCEWALTEGYQVVYLSCKEPPGPEDAAAPRLAALAESLDKTCKVLIPGYSPFDPMRGDVQDIRDRLVKIEEWGDRYWQHCANLLVGLALELSAAKGQDINSLPDLVYSLIRSKLKELSESTDPRVEELVKSLEDRAVAGAMTRYASMALHLREWVAPAAAGGWSFEDADVICAELPTGRRPEAGAALMRLMVRDFGSYLVSRSRRQTMANGKRRPVLFILEEAGAVAGDPVIGQGLVDLVERARSADAFCVLSAQDPMGLGDERAQSAIMTNAAVISYRQTTQAEMVAQLAGTRRTDEGSATYDDVGVLAAGGSTRRQHAFKLNPQLLREMGAGELVVIAGGRYAYAVAAMTAAGFQLPPSKAADTITEQLRDAQELGWRPRKATLDYERTARPPKPDDPGEEPLFPPTEWK